MSRAASPWSAGWRHTWSCIAISSRSGAPSCGLSERAKTSMCGIAGALALRDGARVDRERLCAMAALMGHRGPDGEGFWADPRGRVAFAHRRLSIIDIAGGRQPMCSDDGRIALVFNGEIYNYRELRRVLSDQGVRFHTASERSPCSTRWTTRAATSHRPWGRSTTPTPRPVV